MITPDFEGSIIERKQHSWHWVKWLTCSVFGLLLLGNQSLAAESQIKTVAVQQVRAPVSIKAYAEISVLTKAHMRAPMQGVLADWRLSPGDLVHAGQILAHLAGPQVADLQASRQLQVQQAKVAVHLAQQERSIVHWKFGERLDTRQAVDEADAKLSRANNELTEAKQALQYLRQRLKVVAPVNGTVSVIRVDNGEKVQLGQNLAIIVPAQANWLQARVFGSDARQVYVGMSGVFRPADGGAAIAVRLKRILPVDSPDGGRSILLRPVQPGTTAWRSGVSGMLTLSGSEQTWLKIPSTALVLDQGHWWVLVQTGKGMQKRQVQPGPATGCSTLIRDGLKAGEQVIVSQSYLHFHRDFARDYQPPD